MTWLDKRKYLDTSGGWLRRDAGAAARPDPLQVEKAYSVTDVAQIFSVSRSTVFKWLSPDEESGESVIPANGWYKLPGQGHIRIREWVVKKLQEGI